MLNEIVLALQITLVGMGLVFASLILLWWVMALLTSVTSDKESASGPADLVSVMENEDKGRAAAIAVAFGLAQEQSAHARPLADPPTAIVSAWQLGTRTKQLYQKGERIKHPFRKSG